MKKLNFLSRRVSIPMIGVAGLLVTTVNAQLVPGSGQDLWQWHNEFITDPTVAAGTGPDEEGSSYAQHEKLMKQWATRLFPSGDVQLIGDAARAHRTFLSSNSRDAEPFISNWVPLGPFNTPPTAYSLINHTGVGQIHRIVFAPDYGSTNTTVYCASAFGGLFKSIDDGATWDALTDHAFPFIGVSDLHIDPVTGTLFVCTGSSDQSLGYSSGVWRSTNNGLDWENITQDLYFGPNAQFNNIFRMLVSPSDPNIQFIATANGVYRTTNAFAAASQVTWQQVLQPLGIDNVPLENYWKGLTFQYGSNQILFASGKDVYMSTDVGETWSSITGAGTGLDFDQAPWDISSPTSNGAAVCTRINLGVSSRDANLLHAFVNLGKNGNGSSHAFVLEIPTMTWSYRYRVSNDIGSYSTSPSWVAFLASPAGTPETYYYGGRFLKRGSGSSLPSTMGSGVLHDDFQEAVFSPDATKLWIGTHGGIYRASNPFGPFVASEWVPLNNQLQVGTIYACSANPVRSGAAFIGNQDCGTSYRDPSIFSETGDWRHLMGGDGTSNAISPDGRRGWNWLLAPRSLYFRHGWPFTNQPSLFQVGVLGSFDEQEVPPQIFQPHTGRWLFGSSDLWEEIDMYSPPTGSSSFNRLTNIQGDFGLPYFVDNCLTQGRVRIAIAPSNENYIYQATGIKAPSPSCPTGNGSRLIRSIRDQNGMIIPEPASEQQLQFTNLPPPFDQHPSAITGLAVDPTHPERLWVTFSGYEPSLRVWLTEDEGDTWVNADPESTLPNLPINDIVYQQGTEDGLYVAMDVGVYYKNASMTTWAPYFGTLPNVQVNDLDINYCDGKILAGTYGRGLWESDLAEEPTVHLVIDENTTWSFHRNFGQTVRVTNNATLTITSTANFAPGTYLIVEPGAQLIVNGGTLTNSCGEYWGGVQVWGNSAMNQSGGFVGGQYRPTLHQGYLELRNGGVIENALVGAMLNDPLAEDASGGVIRMVNGTVRNCQQGVVIADYMNFGSTTNVPASNRSSFINSTFTVTDALPGGDDFREHVRMSGISGIVFSGCSFKNEQTTITESAKLGYGIHSFDANYKVKGLCQGPPPIPADCPGTIVQRTTFNGLDHGIHALEGISSRSFQVDNTTFTDNICGVYSEGVVGFKVINSRFEVGGNEVPTMTGDFDPSFLGFHRGLFANTGWGFIVDDNQFARSGSAPSEGLVVGYSGDHSDMVFRNTASGLDAAYIGEGVCADPNNRSYIGLNFQCNSNEDNATNFWSRQVLDEPNLADQTIRTHQGKLVRAADNSFDRLAGNMDLRNTNAENNVLTYWWKAPNAPYQPIHIDPPNGAIVTNNSNGTPVNRPEGNCASRRVIFTYPYPPRREPLMNGLMEHRDVYVANKYLHKTLLDGGSTDELVEEVIASWPEEVWLLRNSLLQKSPFLTVEVLEEMMMKPTLPMAIKAEICIANPDATKSEGFLEFLEIKGEPPMPANLVASVEASWQTKTFRTELEASMAHDHGEMTQNANLLFEYYGTDSVEHVDSLRSVWRMIRTPAARYAEALTLLQEESFAAAYAVVEALPEEHDLKEKQESERWRMLALIEFLQQVRGDGRTEAKLTAGEQDALEALIADQHDRPATWAQNILCFHYGRCRAPLTGDAKAAPKSRQVEKENDSSRSQATLRVFPNPASKYVTVELDLAATPVNAMVELKDIAGKVLQTLRVSSPVAQLVFDCSPLASGTYTVQLVNNGVRLLTEKLVIKQ